MQEITNLAERLKKQIQHENETIQSLTQKQLSDMRNELNAIFQQELNTIKADIGNQSERVFWLMFTNRFLWPTVIGVSLCLGIFSGSFAMISHFSDRIIDLQSTVKQLEENGGKIQFNHCGEDRRLCVKIDQAAIQYGKNGEWRILKGY